MTDVRIAQKEPLKKIPSTQAKATNLVAKSACLLFIHINENVTIKINNLENITVYKIWNIFPK